MANDQDRSGFSLLELLIVVAILTVVTVVAVPNVTLALSHARLRASMTSFSGVLQNTRIVAVKQNATMSTHVAVKPYGLIAYVKAASDTSDLSSWDAQVQLQAPVSRVTTPSGPGAPSILDAAALGFAAPETSDPSFNSRGMPCTYSGGNCVSHGFLYYFKETRPRNEYGWAAVSISPAGRVKKWYWNGSAWTD